nr:MAG TPA: hypothetical protein [Bacteriophage sp.]
MQMHSRKLNRLKLILKLKLILPKAMLEQKIYLFHPLEL